MPSKYLFRTQQSVSISSEAAGGDNHAEEEDDSDSKQGDNLDSSEDFGEDNEVTNETFREKIETEVKVRKLVIKTDGMNFVSSFKRKSLDHQESTMEICDTAEESNEEDDEEDDESNDMPAVPDFGTKRRKMSDQQGPSIVIDDDEDTNEYSSEKFRGMDDEAERAALAISSADESEDTLNSENFSNDNSQLEYGGSSYKFDNAKETVTSRRSSFSGTGHDFISDQSPLSYIDPVESSGVSRPLSVNCLDDGDTMDKFGMYQPITECLTDSEENSFYSAETGTDHGRGSDHTLGMSSWRSRPSTSDPLSAQDNDQDDVKAQMESAINSILSLSQGSTQNAPSLLRNNQSNSFSQRSSQLRSLFSDSQDFTSLGLQSNQSNSRIVAQRVSENSSMDTAEDFTTDLDAAVNSILM